MAIEDTVFLPGDKEKKGLSDITRIREISETNEKKAAEKLNFFCNQIRSLALNSRSISLRGIEIDKLTEEDMALFKRWEKGELTLSSIQQQEKILENFKKEAKASLQLLEYFKTEIRKG